MKLISKNRQAFHDYSIGDRLEAGLVLSGQEVKAIKTGHISLKGSFIMLRGGEAYLLNAHVPPYQHAQTAGYEPTRSRKLLLKKKEIAELARERQGKGTAILPIAVYVKRGKVKLEIAVGQGKKAYDKRESIMEREFKRESDRKIKETKNR